MVDELMRVGWEVHLVGTPSARDWIGADEALSRLGVSPRFTFRSPDQSRPTDPDVVVVCPATFNTINKVATGIADNYATSLICETIGAGAPLLIAPMVNHQLWGHPVLSSSFASLSDAGVGFLDVQTGERGLSPIRSGSGEHVVKRFQPSWLAAAVQSMS